MKITLDNMTAGDWEQVAEIKKQGTSSAPSSWEEWDSAHLAECRTVAILCNQVVGWAALAKCESAPEVEVYVRDGCRGAGVGAALLNAVIYDSEEAGIHVLGARIRPENEPALAIFRGCGFRQSGKPGAHGGDVLLLKRQSKAAGKE
jgi:phosphinothricin acetyltransferase